MLISHTGRWIYFACGRTGTTSIETVLSAFDEGEDVRLKVASLLGDRLGRPLRAPDIKHARPRIVREAIGDEWDSYFRFVFVRNPWDWVVSQYMFNLKPGLLKRKAMLKLGRRDLDRLIRVLAFRHPDGEPGNWQSEYVFDENDEMVVDSVCRFEALQEDFDEICTRLHLPRTTLPLTNNVGRLQYPAYYNDESRSRVLHEFRRDIRLLNYTF